MLAPIRLESPLSNEQLLYTSPKLRELNPWKRCTAELETKQEKALRVLLTWAEHETAKREHRLYTTGRDRG